MRPDFWTPSYSSDRDLHHRPDPQTVERMRLQDRKPVDLGEEARKLTRAADEAVAAMLRGEQ